MLKKIGVAATALFASAKAMAIDNTVVTAAFDAAETSVGTGASGVIATVAVVTGIGIVMALLRKV